MIIQTPDSGRVDHSHHPVYQKDTTQLLNWSIKSWFGVAVLGQWLFVFYVVLAYSIPLIAGSIEDWNKVAPNTYVAGDWIRNLSMAMHLLVAVIVIGGGPLQFIPAIRVKYPRFHRINGRTYLIASLLGSMAGMYLILTRDNPSGIALHTGVTLDAFLITLFVAFAYQTAKQKQFDEHRRWALRLFLAVNAVWFFRLGFMGWIMFHQAPVGFDPDTMYGPFTTFLAFAQTLVPLAVLELVFLAQRSKTPGVKLSVALLMFAMTGLTAFGIFSAFMIIWLPHLPF